MKKLTLTVLALACALCLAFGVAACNKDNEKNGAKMTEQQWQTAIGAFSQSKNFSLALYYADGSQYGFVKMDGDKYYDDNLEGYERVYVKDGENYFRYLKKSADADWEKETITAQSYQNTVNNNALMYVTYGSMVISENYSAFTYAGGKYTAASLSAGEGATDIIALTDIELTFSGNAVAKVVCTAADPDDPSDAMKIVIDNIGSTSVGTPTVEEHTAAEYNGKTYVFSYLANPIPGIDNMEEGLEGYTIEFKTENSGTITVPGNNGYTTDFTYTVQGSTINISAQGMSIPLEIHGDYLYMTQPQGFILVFELQSA